MLTTLIILLSIVILLGCVVVWTDGVCVKVNVLYSVTSTFFLILGCWDFIRSGHLSLLFEYGTGIQILTFISGSVWVISVIVVSIISCWSQEEIGRAHV